MKKITKLKNGFIARNLSMAKMALETGNRFIKSKKDLKGKLEDSLAPGVKTLVHELSMMKGSIMKSGQMLSLFAGDFFPKELKDILSKLENQSYFLEYEEIAKQIPEELKEKLKIEKEPFAAASIGQVHKAYDPKSRKELAIKVQYPGIKKAINNDIRILKFLLNSFSLIPKTINTEFIFNEIRKMLIQEMDYKEELRLTKIYSEKVKNHNELIIVKPVEHLCCDKVLVTEFINAFPIRSQEVQSLAQEEKNKLGKTLIDLFFKEIFEWGLVQTDAHFGNFLVDIDHQGKAKLVLLDFGATKEVSSSILNDYQDLLKGSALRNKDLFFNAAKELGYFDQEVDFEFLWEYTDLLSTPYYQQKFNWKTSNLSDEIYKALPQILKNIPQGKPLGEPLFLDRKIASIFYILKELECEFSLIPIREKYFE